MGTFEDWVATQTGRETMRSLSRRAAGWAAVADFGRDTQW